VSYWVVPNRLRAGPYPDGDVLSAGFDTFVDLTEEGELEPYAAGGARHLRFPIPDFGTPSRAQVTEILAALDAELAAGRTVYLHCRAGIGRTGTIAGCFLARDGRSGEEALGLVSPETEAQRDFVRTWAG
jgi:protein-tyrosine phosphatase